MMRDMDDTTKRELRANKPVPTTEFTNSVRKALTMLPEQKHDPELKLLPASIIVFAAVALVCLAVLNHEAIWALFSDGSGAHSTHGNIAANGAATPSPSATGDQDKLAVVTDPSGSPLAYVVKPTASPIPTPADSEETPAPTAETTGAPEAETTAFPPTATPGPGGGIPLPAVDDKYLQSINVSATNEGITEKVVKAGCDGFMLYMQIEVGPLAAGTNPPVNLYVTVDGNSNQIPHFFQFYSSKYHKGYYTYNVRMSLLKPLESGSANIQIAGKLFVDNSGDIKTLAKCNFDLEVKKPEKLNATGDGTIIYGNKAYLEGLYESGMSASLVFSIEDNKARDLATYFDKHTRKEENPPDRIVFQGDDPMILDIIIGKGNLKEKILEELYSPSDGAEADKAWNDIYGKVFIKSNTMILVKKGSGQFQLIVTNMNSVSPLQPTDDLTLFTCRYSAMDVDSSKSILDYATIYTMHIKVN